MEREEIVQRILRVSQQQGMLMSSYIPLKSGVHCLLFGSYCLAEWDFKHWRMVSKQVWRVQRQTTTFLRRSKAFLKQEGYTQVWTRGVFSFYGDLRPLAQAAGWGEYGENGLIQNKIWGSNFLMTAIFFRD